MKILPALAAAIALGTYVTGPATAQTKKPASKPDQPAKADWPTPKKPENLDHVDAKEIASAIQRGVALLLERQEAYDEAQDVQSKAKGKAPEKSSPGAKPSDREKPSSGENHGAKETAKQDSKAQPKAEWPYEGVYRVGGEIDGQIVMEIPIGYRIGGTSICALALLDAAGGKPSQETSQAVMRAFDFVLEHLDDPLMKPDWTKGYDVRGWGHAYGLALLMKMRALHLVPADKHDAVDAKIRELVAILAQTEIKNGGWNYSRPSADASTPSTFMTAPTLQILFEAAQQGERVDPDVVERGLKTLEDARLDTGAFQYGTDPNHKSGKLIEEVAGSTGRSPICETTLYLAGRGSVERIQKAVDEFFDNWEWLEQRRKQSGTHIGPYKIAPYFFFYAHRYCAQAIEMLPEDARPAYRQKLYQLLWHVREADGGWNDRVFQRSESFGTAMTMFALLEPTAAHKPAGWPAPASPASPKK